MKNKNTKNKNILTFGTLNVRGIQQEMDKIRLADDMQKYKMDILGIQETHLKGSGTEEITTSDKKGKYILFYTGSDTHNHHGVGIVTSRDFIPEFSKINNRTCKMDSKLTDRKITFISTYADTLKNSEKNPEIRRDYYEQLEDTVKSVSNRNMLIIAGDFNAKTGSGNKDYPEVVGNFGKGEINSNGKHLVEMSMRNELILTNTQFYHKLSHRSTWVCPERKEEHKNKNGMVRRNPYRNQIDYTLVRKKHKSMLTNSRTYSGINTNSDHRLVMTKMNVKWSKAYKNKQNEEIINMEQLKNEENKKKYQEEVQKKIDVTRVKNNVSQNVQEKWKNIVDTCTIAAKETIGIRKKKKNSEDEEVVKLSKQQLKLKNDINACKNKNKRDEMRIVRNTILKKIHKKLQDIENHKTEEILEELESSNDDSTRMYKAIKLLKIQEPKKRILVDGENGVITDEKQQVEIISNFFEKTFKSEGAEEIPITPPKEMKTPFTGDEVKKAVKSLKNNKSPGADNLKAELIKYGPSVLNDRIAEIYNDMARTGEYPIEVKEGILIPLPKPGKKQGPPGHLRPIILLSILRKILAICLIRRIAHKIYQRIPITQAAYREGRSTTELIFAFKMLAEKAVT